MIDIKVIITDDWKAVSVILELILGAKTADFFFYESLKVSPLDIYLLNHL
jgi:hypothetical protein